MALKVGELFASFNIDSSGIDKAVGTIENKCSAISGSLAKIGTGLSLAVTTPILRIGKQMIQTSIDYESAFAGVRKTVDITSGDIEAGYKRISDALKDMSLNMPQDYIALSGIAESAGQLGVSEKYITSFTQVIADLGVATNLSNEEAAAMLAQYSNITGMDLKNIDRLGSTIVDLGNNTATTEKDIVSMMHRLAGAGSIIGLSDSQIAGLSATLTSLGITAEAGGSAMSRTLSKIDSAVIAGGDSLDAFAEAANVSAEEFAVAWKTDPIQGLQMLINGLAEVQKSGGDVNKVLKELGINDIQSTDMIKRLIGSGAMLTENVNLANNAWDKNIALTEEASKRYATLESKLKMSGNALKNAKAAFGDYINNSSGLGVVADKVKEIAIGFTQLDESSMGAIVKFGALAAAAGPTTLGLSGIVGAIGKIIPMLSFMVSPLGLVVGGLALLATAAIDANNDIGNGFEKIAKTVKSKLPNITKSITGAISNASKRIPKLINSLVSGIKNMLPAIVDSLSGILISLMNAIGENATGIMNIGLTIIDSLTSSLANNSSGLMSAGVDLMVNLGLAILNGIPSIISSLGHLQIAMWQALANLDLKSIGEKIIAGIGEALNSLTEVFGELFTSALEFIKTLNWSEIASTIWGLIKSFTFTVGEWLITLYDGAKTWVGEQDWGKIASDIWNGIKAFAIKAGEWLGGLYEDAKNWVGKQDWLQIGKDIGSKIMEYTLKFGEWCINFIKDALTWIGKQDWLQIGEKIWNGIKTFTFAVGEWLVGIVTGAVEYFAGTDVGEKLQEVGTSIWNWIKGAALSIGDFGKELLDGIWNSIVACWDNFKKNISDIFTGLWEDIKSIFGGGDSPEIQPTINKGGGSRSFELITENDKKTAKDDAKDLAKKVDTEISGVSKNANKYGSDVVLDISAGMSNTTVISEASDAIVTALDMPISEVPEKMTTYTDDAMNGIEDGMNSNKPAIATASKEVSDAAIAAFVQEMNYAGGMSIGAEFANGIRVGISANSGSIASAASYAANSVRNNVKKEMSLGIGNSIGANFARGLAAGIRENVSPIISAAIFAAQSASIAARKTLKIKSPSRVAMYIGEMFGIGGATGILNTVGDVQNASETLSNAMRDSFYVKDPRLSSYKNDSVNSYVAKNNLANLQDSESSLNAKAIGSAIADRIIESGALSGDVIMDGTKVGKKVSPTVSKDIEEKSNDSWIGRSARVVFS